MSSGLTNTITEQLDNGSPVLAAGLQSDSTSKPQPHLDVSGTPSGIPTRLCYLTCDVSSLFIGLITTKLLLSWIAGTWWQSFTIVELKVFCLFGIGKIALSAFQGSYNAVTPRPVRQFRSTTIGTALITIKLLVLVWLFGLGIGAIAPLLIAAAAITYLSTCFLRAYCRMKLLHKKWWGTQVLIVGSNSVAHRTSQYYSREPQWGIRPIGFVTEDQVPEEGAFPIPCLGKIEDIDRIAEETGVSRAFVALHQVDLQEMRTQFVRPDAKIRHWTFIPNLEQVTALWARWSETARMPSLSITNKLAMPATHSMKRAFDLVVSGLTLIVLSPVFLVIGALVYATSKGPMFYSHTRVGRGGQRINTWKFRTMHQNADEVLQRHLDEHPEHREEWLATQKLKHDPRVTSVGRFLRKTSLDELPQLWNVLVGDMSLVGPRPITDSEANKYRNLYEVYQQVLPGITGLWQVSGRNNTTYKERIDLDVYYVENWSVWLDLYILACTVKVVLFREGAY